MADAKHLLEIASRSSVPVLVCGESGTGKEVMARKLHAMSDRSKGPFVAVNCGAISPGLVESLFEGSCRGAYTGAVANQLGFVLWQCIVFQKASPAEKLRFVHSFSAALTAPGTNIVAGDCAVEHWY